MHVVQAMRYERLRIGVQHSSIPAARPEAVGHCIPMIAMHYALRGVIVPVVLAICDFLQRGSSTGHGLHGEGLVPSNWHLCCTAQMDPFKGLDLAFLRFCTQSAVAPQYPDPAEKALRGRYRQLQEIV